MANCGHTHITTRCCVGAGFPTWVVPCECRAGNPRAATTPSRPRWRWWLRASTSSTCSWAVSMACPSLPASRGATRRRSRGAPAARAAGRAAAAAAARGAAAAAGRPAAAAAARPSEEGVGTQLFVRAMREDLHVQRGVCWVHHGPMTPRTLTPPLARRRRRPQRRGRLAPLRSRGRN